MVKFEVVAHGKAGNFSVPSAVLHQLGIGQDAAIHLVITGDGFAWEGTIEMRSGEQIYAKRQQPWTHGLRSIRPYQRLSIFASRPTD